MITENKSIIVGCDNAAVDFKNKIIKYLEENEYSVEDAGCDGENDETYYPFIAERVCQSIIDGGYRKRGILICGTGIGMTVSANKFPGIRAAVCHDIFSTERSILSNDSNVMCMGARIIAPELAHRLVDAWLKLEFIPGASSLKVQAIRELEEKNMAVAKP